MPNLNWPLRKVVSIERDWTGASVATLECGHGWSETASFRWPKRTRCFTCALAITQNHPIKEAN